jgi:histidine ammonia-lyase
MISRFFINSPFINHESTQNDYCIRCIPQIFGPKLEAIKNVYGNIQKELNAVTDNPLIFRNDEISPDVSPERIHTIKSDRWTVLSCGNFHGEYVTAVSDYLAFCNAKIALTLERQMTYMLNPDRNKLLPTYLVYDKKNVGLLSGYMIVQYTGNALAQKIAHMANPFSSYNLTSGNEAEDVVSYGATSAMRLLEQIDMLHDLNTCYLALVLQAYSITRTNYIKNGITIPQDLPTEKIYQLCMKELKPLDYPTVEDIPFDQIYAKLSNLLKTSQIRDIIGAPISSSVGCRINNYFMKK